MHFVRVQHILFCTDCSSTFGLYIYFEMKLASSIRTRDIWIDAMESKVHQMHQFLTVTYICCDSDDIHQPDGKNDY